MLSALFTGDPLLEAIAQDTERISRTRHSTDPAVALVQEALLIWDPDCLPVSGADQRYGDETAAAVARFKVEVLLVPPKEVIDDVGPRTVIGLDEIAAVSEVVSVLGAVAVTAAGVDADSQAAFVAAVEQSGGQILLGLGERAAVFTGGQETFDAVEQMLGGTLSALLTPSTPELPGDIDADTAELVTAWLMLAEPEYVLSQLDPNRFGVSFASLGCGGGTGTA